MNLLDFIHSVESDLGVPEGGNNDEFFVAWQRAEGNPGINQNNPWNIATGTGRPFGGTGGVAGTAAFASPDAGAAATAAYIAKNSGPGGIYAAFAQDLKNNADPRQTATDIGLSPWAYGHYDPTDPKPGPVDLGTEPGHTIMGVLGLPPLSGTGSSSGTGAAAQLTGFNSSPSDLFGIPGAIGGFFSDSVAGGLRQTLAWVALLVGGIGLVVLGLKTFAQPALNKIESTAETAGAGAAMAAA